MMSKVLFQNAKQMEQPSILLIEIVLFVINPIYGVAFLCIASSKLVDYLKWFLFRLICFHFQTKPF